MRVKCLAHEHNTMTRPGLEPGPFDPESSALTNRPPPEYFKFFSPILSIGQIGLLKGNAKTNLTF